MKKLLSFTLILSVLLASFSTLNVFADVSVYIPANDGKGTVLVGGVNTLVSAGKNCSNTENSTGTNKNWSVVSIADIDDPYFDKAIRIESKGTIATPGTNQVRAAFSTEGIGAGEYIYVSFYFRQLSEFGDKTFTEKAPSFSTPELGINSGRVTPITQTGAYLNATDFDTWYKVAYIYPLSGAVASGNTYLQFGFSKPSAGLPEYVIEVAGLNIMTFGVATGPSTDMIKTEIIKNLDNADFSSVKFDGNEVDLDIYPEQYSEMIYWNGTLPVITGKDVNGKDVLVEYESDSVPQKVKLTAFAMDYDVTSTTDTRYKEYFVNIDYYRASTSVSVDGVETNSLSGCVGGEEVELSSTIYNPNNETATYVAVMCIYKGKKCIAAIPGRIFVTNTDVSKTETLPYTLPVADYSGCEVKSYVISPLRMFKVN